MTTVATLKAYNTVTGQWEYVDRPSATGAGSGDVIGPAASTDNAIARFDLATGKVIQNSLVQITDAGTITGLANGVTPGDAATVGQLGSKVDTARTVSTTAPLTGGGDLSANRTLGVTTFTGGLPGVVPDGSAVDATAYLNGNGGWTVPAGGGTVASNIFAYQFSTTTTAPPTGSQIRMNNANQTLATQVWIRYVSSDGNDVHNRLLLAPTGSLLYIQDRDDATRWQAYTLQAEPTDVPADQYVRLDVVWDSGGSPLLAQAVLAQILYSGSSGGITSEGAVDAVAAALTEGAGIDIVYNDPANTITVTFDKTEVSFAISDISGLQAALDAKAGMSIFTGAAAGLTPASGGGTVNFLRADGTFAVPPGVGMDVEALMDHLGTIGLVAGANVSLIYNDPAGTITINSTGSGGGGIDVETAVDAVAAALTAGNNIDITYNDTANTITIDVEALVIGDVSGLQAALDAKSDTTHTHTGTYQPLDSDLTTIAALAPTNDSVIQRKGGVWVASTPATVKTDLALTKADVGLANVDNTSDANKPVSTAQAASIATKADAAATTAALNGKVDTTRTIGTTAPLTGGGTLAADRTLDISTFTATVKGAVPPPTTAVAKFLRDDGTWAYPPGGGGSLQSIWQWTASAVSSALANGRIGVNNDAPASATQIWINKIGGLNAIDWSTTISGLVANDHVYLQSKGDASSFHRYTVTGTPTLNSGTTYVIPVVTDTGSPAGTEPPTNADTLVVFEKTSVPVGAVPQTRAVLTTAPLSGGGDLSVDRTLSLLNDGITNALLANSPALTFKGNNTGAVADPKDMTVTEAKTMLAITTADITGLSGLATATTLAAVNTAITDADVPAALNGVTGVWAGTQAQYDAIGTKVSTVLYFITA